MTRKTQKKLRKLLTLVSCAVLLVCVTVVGTVAYLTSTASVENTFTTGKVKIDLTEAAVKQDETTDNIVEDSSKPRVKANSYKLLPGISYAKDPTVTVKAGSEESYIRVLVTVDKSSELDAIFETNNYDIAKIVLGTTTDWLVNTITEDTTANTRTYELRYKETVTPAENVDTVLPDVFQQIVMPGDITNAQLDTIAGMKINVVAQAIQADGFATADLAWAAFEA